MNSPRPPPTTLVGDDSSPGDPYEKYGLMTEMTGTFSPRGCSKGANRIGGLWQNWDLLPKHLWCLLRYSLLGHREHSGARVRGRKCACGLCSIPEYVDPKCLDIGLHLSPWEGPVLQSNPRGGKKEEEGDCPHLCTPPHRAAEEE